MLDRIVREAARAHGDLQALVDRSGAVVTYRALDERSDRIAAALIAAGVREGDVVALTLPSSPDYVLAYAAASKIGAITCGVNPRLSDEQRARALALIEPAIIIDAEPPTKPGAPEPLASDPDRVVALVLTSGTSGEPKAAVFRERQMLAIERMDSEAPPPGTPMLASTEFAHIGFMTRLPKHLVCGMRIHMLGRWRARDALELIERERLPSVGGIAAQIALLLRDPTFDERDLSSVRLIVAGGAPSPPALIIEARARFGAAYSVRYSMTESGGMGTLTAPDAPDEETLHTVGRARPGVQLEIRDEDDRALPRGETGEVCLRAPSIMSGYWRDADASERALRGGWLHTGDLGFIDEAGCLRLAGRAKEMYIRGGYNVYPAAVERVLLDHPGVADVGVTSRADEVMGEIGVALVVPADHERAPSLDDLRAFARDRLAAHELPEAIRIVRELPLNAMHKLDRRALADLDR